jgi:hypothetical protein
VTYFTADRRWAGQTVACIASGPSLTREDCDSLRAARLPAIAVNNAGLPPMAHWADVHYAADGRWWEAHSDALDYDRLKLAANGDVHGVQLVHYTGKSGFEDRPDAIRTGRNSGYQALHLAAHFGARRIILLGYDMQATGGETHFHGYHARPMNNPGPGNFARWREHFAELAPELEKRGMEVINCTRETALTCFRRMSLEDVLCSA